MKTRESKKNEYWNHFLEQKNFHFFGFTKIRLERAKKIIWHDKDFWWDVLDRHPGMKMTPDEMKTNELDQYGHEYEYLNFIIMVYFSFKKSLTFLQKQLLFIIQKE